MLCPLSYGAENVTNQSTSVVSLPHPTTPARPDKFAYESGQIDRPTRFGPGFKRPSKKTLRLERAKPGPKLLTGDEVRRMIDGAGTPLRAMVLPGINLGYGNADVEVDAGGAFQSLHHGPSIVIILISWLPFWGRIGLLRRGRQGCFGRRRRQSLHQFLA